MDNHSNTVETSVVPANTSVIFYLDHTTIVTNVVTSILTVVTNVYGLVACMCASEKKWHPTFALHQTLFFIYTLYGMGSLMNSVRKLFTVQLFQVTMVDRLRCCSWYLIAIVTQSAMVDLHLLLAVDRLLAFYFPLWYRFRYKKNVLYGQLSAVVVHGLCALLMRYVSLQENGFQVCIIFNVGSSMVIELTFYGYYFMLALALVVNVLLVVLIKRKCSCSCSSSGATTTVTRDKQSYSRKRELKVITTLALCVVTQIITLVISQVLKHLAVHQSNLSLKIIITSWSNILDLSGLANFLVISLKKSELQKILLRPLRVLYCRLKSPHSRCPSHERIALYPL